MAKNLLKTLQGQYLWGPGEITPAMCSMERLSVVPQVERKDIAVWKEAKPYMGFFYDEYLEKPAFDEKFAPETVKTALSKFLEKFDICDDSAVWFDKVKAITEEMGFTTDMKAYKATPDAFPGTVADVSTFIRQAVTGKTNSPDLYTVMQILGYDRTVARIKAVMETL